MKDLFYISLGIGSLLTLTSCDKKQTAQAAQSEVIEPTWDWKQYDRDRILELGNYSVSVQPKQSIELTANYAGILTLYVNKKTSQVTKDFLWAEMDKKKLADDKKRLELKEQNILLESKKEDIIDRPQKLKDAQKKLDDARKRVALAKQIYSSKTLQKRAATLLGGDIKHVTKKVIQELEEELSLAESNYNVVLEVEDVLYKNGEQLEKMDIDQARKEYDLAKEAAAYEIPFDGELRIELDYLENEDEYSVGGREVLATLNDYSQIHATLEVEKVGFIDLDPQSLTLHLKNSQKTKMGYLESRVEKNKRTRVEEKKYIFGLPLESDLSLKRLAGTKLDAKLTTELSEMCYIVPKFDISMYAKGKTVAHDWPQRVSELWPGAKVLAVGTNTIAISYRAPR